MALRTIGAICRRSNGAGFKLATPRKDRAFAPTNLRPQHWPSQVSGANIFIQKRFTLKKSQRVYDIARVDDITAEVEKLFEAGEIEKAATSLREALESICPDSSDPYTIVRCFEQFSKLGELYTIQQKWSDAKPVYQRLVAAIENVIVSQREQRSLIVARCQREGKSLEMDEDYIEVQEQLKALDTALASICHDLAGSHERLREFDDAQKSYKQSLERYALIGDTRGQANVSAALGTLYEKVGNLTDAEQYNITAMRDNPLCERWDHPNYATGLHPHHRRPEVVTVDSVLASIEASAAQEPAASEFTSVDDSADRNKESNSELVQKTLTLLSRSEESTERAQIQQAIDEAMKFNVHATTLEMEGAKTVLREAEARLAPTQMYLMAPAFIYLATMQKRLGLLSESWNTLERCQEAYKASGLAAFSPHSLAWSNLLVHKGHLCNYVKDVEKATAFYKEALQLKQAIQGPDALHVAMLNFDLSVAMIESKQFTDGLYLLIESARVLQHKLGNDHVWVSKLRDATQLMWDAVNKSPSPLPKPLEEIMKNNRANLR